MARHSKRARKSAKIKDEYLVASIDPGITDGCITVVDVLSGRVLDCRFFSLVEIKDRLDGVYAEKTESLAERQRRAEAEGKRKSAASAKRKRSGGKTSWSQLSMHRVAECVHYLVREEHRQLFDNVNCTFIEAQIKPHLKTIQACMQMALLGRCVLSFPAAVRNHYDISVKGATEKARRLEDETAAQAVHGKAYAKRKKLSEEVAKRLVSKENMDFMRNAARQYWKCKRRRRFRGAKTMSQIEARRKKSLNDAIEAYLQAMFPGNWAKIEQECRSLRETYRRPGKDRADSLSEAKRRQHASRCLTCDYGLLAPTPVPSALRHLHQEHQEHNRERRLAKARENRRKKRESAAEAKEVDAPASSSASVAERPKTASRGKKRKRACK